MSYGVCETCVELRELLSAVARAADQGVVGATEHAVTVKIDRELWERLQSERNP